MKQKIPIELMRKYLTRRKKDFSDCVFFLNKKMYTSLEEVGHKLKGNGSTFGFEDLSLIGGDLQRAAELKDEDRIKEVLRGFSYWVSSLD